MGGRWWRNASAALFGVVIALTVVDGDPGALAVGVVLTGGLILLAMAFSSKGSGLIPLVAVASGVHLAIALAVHMFAPGFGGGFVTGDDANYFHVSAQTARALQGLPVDPSYEQARLNPAYAYELGSYVYLETSLFRVFGPDVRIPLLLNGALAVVTVIFVYAGAERIFGRRPALFAAAVVGFYPSLILWSALNLRDPLIVAIATIAVWAMISFAAKPGPVTLVLPFLAAAELVELRGYAGAIIAFAAVLSIIIALSRSRRSLVAVVIVSVALLVVVQRLSAFGGDNFDQVLVSFENARASLRAGANTAIDPPTQSPDTPVLVRTLSYLPFGVAYAIFAPVPLVAPRAQERLAAPEMIVWYLLCIGTVVTLWHERRHWRLLAPPAFTSVGLLLALALGEGSVGDLFRHRAMVVPFVALLGAPVALRVHDRRRRHTFTDADR